MKKMTIWQRLNVTSAAFGVLLLTGILLALWAEHSLAVARQRSDELNHTRVRVYYDLTRMSDAVRGALIDSKTKTETNSFILAQRDLASVLPNLQDEFDKHPELIRSFKILNTFIITQLFPFDQKLFEMAEKDSAAATLFYSENYRPLQVQRDKPTSADPILQMGWPHWQRSPRFDAASRHGAAQ